MDAGALAGWTGPSLFPAEDYRCWEAWSTVVRKPGEEEEDFLDRSWATNRRGHLPPDIGKDASTAEIALLVAQASGVAVKDVGVFRGRKITFALIH
jgi:hypothetical protein